VDQPGRHDPPVRHDQRRRERQLARELAEPGERPVAEHDAGPQLKVEGPEHFFARNGNDITLMAGRSLVRAPPLAATGITACVGLVLQHLEGLPEVFAPPVGAGGRVYIAGRDASSSSSVTGRHTRCWPPTSWTR